MLNKDKENSMNVEKSVLAQTHQIRSAEERMLLLKKNIETIDEKASSQETGLDLLDKKMGNLFKALGINKEKLDISNVTPKILLKEEEDKAIEEKYFIEPLKIIEFTSYDDYICKVDKYLQIHDIDTTVDPILQMMTSYEIENALKDYNTNLGKIKWDKLDYGIVALAAIVGILVDFVIVRIPKDMNFKGVQYKGSKVSEFLRNESSKIMNRKDGIYGWLGNLQKFLEEYAKVPYDKSINTKELNVDGLNPRLHRLMSLGHDPILGLVFGVVDLLRGSMTSVDKNGVIKVVFTGEGSFNIFENFLKVIAHIGSDITTPQGVQPPFFTLLQCIKAKSSITLKENGEKVSYTNVARFVYTNGYDLRHFATMSLVPMVVEIIIRTYYNLKNFERLYKAEKDTSHKYKLASMLTLAHGLTSSGNLIKFWFYGNNPLALNYSEFLMLIKSFISLYKAEKARDKYVDEELINGWKKLSSSNVNFQFSSSIDL